MHSAALLLAILSVGVNVIACGFAALVDEPKSSVAFAAAALFSFVAAIAGYDHATTLAVFMLLATLAGNGALALPFIGRLLRRRRETKDASGTGDAAVDPALLSVVTIMGAAPAQSSDLWGTLALGAPVITSGLASIVAALS